MIESRVEDFTKLDFVKKKEKIIAILSELNDDDGFFREASSNLDTNKNLTSEILISVYKDILEFSEELKNIDKVEEKEVIGKLKDKMSVLKEQEKSERAEERPEELLNLI